MAIDYSSQSYWRVRLSKEKDQGFEWLVPSSDVLSTISQVVGDLKSTTTRISILHFGCGSSSLGIELQRHLGDRVAVSDADYASSSLHSREPTPNLSDTPWSLQVPLHEIDVLDLNSLRSITPADGWDVLVDKSTADAISCHPPLPSSSPSNQESGADQVDALDVLCNNLSAVASQHCRWVSVSYSPRRFDFLAHRPDGRWRVVAKIPARLQPTTSTKDGHVVHQPVTGTWVWVLEHR